MSDPPPPGDVPSYADMTLEHVLDAFSDATAAPGGGGAAVLAVALSAALCAMSARLSSRQMHDAAAIATEAVSIRDDMVPLCARDARSFLDVISARRIPDERNPDKAGPHESGPAGPDAAGRRRRIVDALSAATEVPMATLEAGARLTHLAARLAEEGNAALRGDALVAAVLAGAGAEGAATLVRINLAELPDDHRHGVVQSLVDDATAQVERARRAAAVLI
jgi:methenyltetrahydrofolate cyclohydrolase